MEIRALEGSVLISKLYSQRSLPVAISVLKDNALRIKALNARAPRTQKIRINMMFNS